MFSGKYEIDYHKGQNYSTNGKKIRNMSENTQFFLGLGLHVLTRIRRFKSPSPLLVS